MTDVVEQRCHHQRIRGPGGQREGSGLAGMVGGGHAGTGGLLTEPAIEPDEGVGDLGGVMQRAPVGAGLRSAVGGRHGPHRTVGR